MSDTLFDPVKLGDISLSNRLLMAPLTRGRTGASRTPDDLTVEYYAQRASAGLIISEATAISEQGYGWYGAPAIYTDTHVAAWKKVTDAVHKHGGKIVLQLWHMGRLSHPSLQKDGALPVAPSAIKPDGHTRDSTGKKDYVVPRALDVAELPGIVADYVAAARRAIDAGFDGVEIHGANGYLIDQFIRDGANQRSDEYGGSIENRLRFMKEVVAAVTAEVGAGKTGIRISPTNPNGGTKDSDPVKTFTAVAQALNEYNLAYVHVMEPSPDSGKGFAGLPYVLPEIREAYKGNLIVNGGYDVKSGNAAIESGLGQAVAFGVPFIANPDLVERFRTGAPLNTPHPETFYGGAEEGYTDYPFLGQKAA
ncbi:MAG: alkene reductase [Micavibrio aeruginosavorus]|uniref:Alkene reductase n=1 Tax=Micavibrio aeruginosavorus TaxID=349221 RepID=A0A2W5N084_9BACT|nr:MAG: alkene reductase [Micavibrio aeruginosavorus]